MRRVLESRPRRVERMPPPEGDAGRALLAKLAKRFTQFRKQHQRGARLPQELREAVLAALGQVPPGDLYRACGVSFRQVMAWKAAKARSTVDPDVRVFTVADDETSALTEPTVTASASGLELRFGPWSVSVRLAGDVPAARGAACCR